MMVLSYANCLGASNIMNINLKDFQNAKLYPDLEVDKMTSIRYHLSIGTKLY